MKQIWRCSKCEKTACTIYIEREKMIDKWKLQCPYDPMHVMIAEWEFFASSEEQGEKE